MNWNRLRFLGHLLADAIEIEGKRDFHWRLSYGSKGLPPVRIVFLEDEQSGSSWLGQDGKLKTSLPLPSELLLGEEPEHASDLVLLLRALAPIRRSNKFFVEPTLPEPVRNLDFSLAWMSKKSTQTIRFGECMDMQWNDLLSYHWLTRFEIYLHRLLHSLDTPIAPFLRLEQMATVSHTEHARIRAYAAQYKQTSDICKAADDIMTAIGKCAFVLAPEQGRCLCRCVDINKDDAHICRGLRFGEYDTDSCHFLHYQTRLVTVRQQWEDEFTSVRRRLLRANGCSLTGDGRLSAADFQPSNPAITLAEIAGFEHYVDIAPTTAWEVNHLYDPCECYSIPLTSLKKGNRKTERPRKGNPEVWIKAWPCGIIHEKEVILSHMATHVCEQLQHDYAIASYICLDRLRRDDKGICGRGEHNKSAPFLVQFAHFVMKNN